MKIRGSWDDPGERPGSPCFRALNCIALRTQTIVVGECYIQRIGDGVSADAVVQSAGGRRKRCADAVNSVAKELTASSRESKLTLPGWQVPTATVAANAHPALINTNKQQHTRTTKLE
jgi:hypothetical protein